jgi:hypothetical protein
MTVSDLLAELQRLVAAGYGTRLVRMGDPTTSDYAEVTGLWIPTDEPVIDLEAAEWTPAPDARLPPRRSPPRLRRPAPSQRARPPTP